MRQGVFNSFGPMMGVSLEVKAGSGRSLTWAIDPSSEQIPEALIRLR